MKISRILARTTGRRVERGLRRNAEGRRKGVEEETAEEKEREAIAVVGGVSVSSSTSRRKAEKTRENWFE